jgi:hypothetical protein
MDANKKSESAPRGDGYIEGIEFAIEYLTDCAEARHRKGLEEEAGLFKAAAHGLEELVDRVREAMKHPVVLIIHGVETPLRHGIDMRLRRRGS